MRSDESDMVATADSVAEIWRGTRAVWDSIANHDDDQFRVMTDIIDAARAVPVLRQLHGSTSHFTLQFSTCLEHPWSDGIPAIEPRQFNERGDRPPGPGYVIRNRPRGDVIAEADDAESAITLLLAHLPADVGPAGPCRHVHVPRHVLFNGFVTDEVSRITSEPVGCAVEYAGGGDWSVSIRPAGADADRRMLVCPKPAHNAEAILRAAARMLLCDTDAGTHYRPRPSATNRDE